MGRVQKTVELVGAIKGERYDTAAVGAFFCKKGTKGVRVWQGNLKLGIFNLGFVGREHKEPSTKAHFTTDWCNEHDCVDISESTEMRMESIAALTSTSKLILFDSGSNFRKGNVTVELSFCPFIIINAGEAKKKPVILSLLANQSP